MGDVLNPFEPPKAKTADIEPRRSSPSRNRFDLVTDLSPDEAREALEAAIEPMRWIRFAWTPRRAPFEGRMIADTFDCRRTTNARRALVPRIRGVIERHPLGGSRIRGTIDFHTPKAYFQIVGLGVVSYLFVHIGVARVQNTDSPAASFVAFAL